MTSEPSINDFRQSYWRTSSNENFEMHWCRQYVPEVLKLQRVTREISNAQFRKVSSILRGLRRRGNATILRLRISDAFFDLKQPLFPFTSKVTRSIHQIHYICFSAKSFENFVIKNFESSRLLRNWFLADEKLIFPCKVVEHFRNISPVALLIAISAL